MKMPVLFVDDNLTNLVAYETILEDEDLDIYTCLSGEEAVGMLRNKNDFGLIVMDILMPQMDGVETAKLIKIDPKMKHIPILFVTALGDNESWLERAYETGAVDYVAKPINAKLLIYKVRSYQTFYDDRVELLRLKEKCGGE